MNHPKEILDQTSSSSIINNIESNLDSLINSLKNRHTKLSQIREFEDLILYDLTYLKTRYSGEEDSYKYNIEFLRKKLIENQGINSRFLNSI